MAIDDDLYKKISRIQAKLRELTEYDNIRRNNAVKLKKEGRTLLNLVKKEFELYTNNDQAFDSYVDKYNENIRLVNKALNEDYKEIEKPQSFIKDGVTVARFLNSIDINTNVAGKVLEKKIDYLKKIDAFGRLEKAPAAFEVSRVTLLKAGAFVEKIVDHINDLDGYKTPVGYLNKWTSPDGKIDRLYVNLFDKVFEYPEDKKNYKFYYEKDRDGQWTIRNSGDIRDFYQESLKKDYREIVRSELNEVVMNLDGRSPIKKHIEIKFPKDLDKRIERLSSKGLERWIAPKDIAKQITKVINQTIPSDHFYFERETKSGKKSYTKQDIEKYSRMWVRDFSAKNDSEATIASGIQTGNNIVHVTPVNDSVYPVCIQHMGQDFRLTSAIPGNEELPVITVAPPFHPNCVHIFILVVGKSKEAVKFREQLKREEPQDIDAMIKRAIAQKEAA